MAEELIFEKLDFLRNFKRKNNFCFPFKIFKKKQFSLSFKKFERKKISKFFFVKNIKKVDMAGELILSKKSILPPFPSF